MAGTATDQATDNSMRQRFERCVLPHLDAAYGLARWLVHDEQVAEDIVQDAFLRALQQFSSFRGDAAKPWLLARVHQAVRDWQARNPAPPHAGLLADTQEAAAQAFEAATPAPPRKLKLGRAQVNTALARLAQPLREVLVLSEIEELSPEDTALVLGISSSTALAHLAQARRQLYLHLRDGDRRPEHERP